MKLKIKEQLKKINVGKHSLSDWSDMMREKVINISSKLGVTEQIDHFERVVENAIEIALEEGMDLKIILPLAWLYETNKIVDIFSIMKELEYPTNINQIVEVLQTKDTVNVTQSKLNLVLHDAIKLENYGAIGLSRLFLLAGKDKQEIYNPSHPFPHDTPPRPYDTQRYIIDLMLSMLDEPTTKFHTTFGQRESKQRIERFNQYLTTLRSEIISPLVQNTSTRSKLENSTVNGKSLLEWSEKLRAVMLSIDERCDPAHRIDHLDRVAATAIKLSILEGADLCVVLPAIWLHDCYPIDKGDPNKVHASSLSAEKAVTILSEIEYDEKYFESIKAAIRSHSYSAGILTASLEARIVQDADRLDALGAIGLARVVMVGGQYNNSLYHPEDPFPTKGSGRKLDEKKYIVDHFYEKLLNIADRCNTDSARIEANNRTQILTDFLYHLADEISAAVLFEKELEDNEDNTVSKEHNLDSRALKFFSKIENLFKPYNLNYKLAFIVVTHTAPDMPEFLAALNRCGRVASVIYKSSFSNSHVERKINSIFGDTFKELVLENRSIINKESLKKDPFLANQLIASKINSNEKCIILDIGGYFAPCLSSLSSDITIASKLLGIVEDTENGHQKYEENIEKSNFPVWSVARSQQKKTEDYNVGKSIVQCTETFLRKIGKRIQDFKTVGVFGLGKIGSSIAKHVRDEHAKELVVYDIDASRTVEAISYDFKVVSRKEILSRCDLIFCATGNHCLNLSDLEFMSNRDVYIASCTSSDDEFDLNLSEQGFFLQEESDVKYIKYCLNKNKKNGVYFLASGNAINFYFSTNILGDFIRAVQGAILASAYSLLLNDKKEDSNDHRVIHTLTTQSEKIISRAWLDLFSHTGQYGIANINYDRLPRQQFHQRTKNLLLQSFRPKLSIVPQFICLYGEDKNGLNNFVDEYIIFCSQRYDLIWVFNNNVPIELEYRKLASKLGLNSLGLSALEILSTILELVRNRNYLFIWKNIDPRNDYDATIEAISSHHSENPWVQQHNLFLAEKADVLTNSAVKAMKLGRSITVISSKKNDFVFDDNYLLSIISGQTLAFTLLKKYLAKIMNSSGSEECKHFFQMIQQSSDKLKFILKVIFNDIRQITINNIQILYEYIVIFSHLSEGSINKELLNMLRIQFSIDEHIQSSVLAQLENYGLINFENDNTQSYYLLVPDEIRNYIHSCILSTNLLRARFVYKVIRILESFVDFDFFDTSPQAKLNEPLIENANSLFEYVKRIGPIEYSLNIYQNFTEEEIKEICSEYKKTSADLTFGKFHLFTTQSRSKVYFIGYNAYTEIIEGYLEHLPKLNDLTRFLCDGVEPFTVLTNVVQGDEDLKIKILSLIVPVLDHTAFFSARTSRVLCGTGYVLLNHFDDFENAYNYFQTVFNDFEAIIPSICKLMKHELIDYIASLHGKALCELKRFTFKDGDELIEDDKHNLEIEITKVKNSLLKNQLLSDLEKHLTDNLIGSEIYNFVDYNFTSEDLFKIFIYLADMQLTCAYLLKKYDAVRSDRFENKDGAYAYIDKVDEYLKFSESALNDIHSSAHFENYMYAFKRLQASKAQAVATLNSFYFPELIDKVKNSFEEAIKSRRTLPHNKTRQDLAKSLHDYGKFLAKIAISREDYFMASGYIKESMTIQEKTLSQKHPAYLENLKVFEKISIRLKSLLKISLEDSSKKVLVTENASPSIKSDVSEFYKKYYMAKYKLACKDFNGANEYFSSAITFFGANRAKLEKFEQYQEIVNKYEKSVKKIFS